jgi:hypothetical protein
LNQPVIENITKLGYIHSGGSQCLFLNTSAGTVGQNSRRLHIARILKSFARIAQAHKSRSYFRYLPLLDLHTKVFQMSLARARAERPGAECAVISKSMKIL